MKILIADDDLISRKLLNNYLVSYGECFTASDGNEAMELFLRLHKKNSPFDIIFLDIMMPGLLGHEVLKKIREKEEVLGIETGYGVRIVMSTSLKDTENIMAAFSGGCEHYLVKPVKKEKIVEIMKELGVSEIG